MGSNEKNEMQSETHTDSAAGNDSAARDAATQETPVIAEYTVPEEPPKKRRRGWIVVVAILLVLVAVFFAARALRQQRLSTDAGAYTTYTVQRNDITVTLSGSGTLQPADSYTITSLISGDILSAPFEEGDIVSKDQVLFDVDSSDVDSSVKQAENNVSDSQNKYESTLKQLDNLKLKATGAGTIMQLNVEKGDTVQAGQVIAVIRESDIMSIKVLFQKDAAVGFYVGESAIVSLGGTYETYTGTVSNISPMDQVLTGNAVAREVTIDVTNPGAFSPSMSAYVSVAGINGLQNGTVDYKYQGSVMAAASGTVSKVNVSEGSHVTKGQIIAVLQSDSVDQQIQSAHSALENAKLALENQSNKVTGYSIKSPISGTIVEKDYKEGDTLKAGEILCTVFDLSHLTLTLNVDELDIKKVQTGQTVTVTADAAMGTEYTGTVTKINIKGTTKNGVTSYPVTIQIDQTDGLLPGMNVDAKIVVASLKNVLTVPVSAVLRNNFVLLKTGEESPKVTTDGIPAGFSNAEVKLGASNDTDIVITEGLTEGDIIAVMDNTPTSYDYNLFQRPQNRVETAASGTAGSSGAVSQGQSSQTAAGVSG